MRPIKGVKDLVKKHPYWILFFLVVGISSVALFFFAFFSPYSENDVKARSNFDVELGTPNFYNAIEGISLSPFFPIEKEIVVLNNGDEFMPDLLREIENATSSIHLANYIFAESDLTDDLFDLLIEKARRGVEVRVLMDATGSLSMPDTKIKELEDVGGQVGKFRPVVLGTLMHINKRSHMRSMTIDGRVGYIGGFVFDDTWLGDGTSPDKWRDIMFKFEGTGARSIQHHFTHLWRQTTGEIVSGENSYASSSAPSLSACVDSCFIPLFHAPSPDVERDLSDFLWLSIMGANDHIYLETPYFLPNDDIEEALKSKAREGVRVEVIVPGGHIDSRPVHLASISYFKDLIEAGVKIYEYQPGHFHSKVAIFDGHWSIIGSANMDNRSSILNLENIFGVEDKVLAMKLEEQFELDKSRSKQVTPENLPNTFETILGKISHLFAKQY